MSLKAAIKTLSGLYPAPASLDDPVALMVWENVGYLVDDKLRNELFAEFERRIGFKAPEIANAPMPILLDIAMRGGMHPQKRAERLRDIGKLALSECDGDVRGRLRELPLPKARVLLKKFPAIGDPGADRILLFAGIAPVPALDSNALRALVRMGFADEGKSYAQAYRSGIAALAKDGAGDFDWLKHAWLVLRAHGKALCKRAAPICEPCPLDRFCAHRIISDRV